MKTSLVLINIAAALATFVLSNLLYYMGAVTNYNKLHMMEARGVISSNSVSAFLDSQAVGASIAEDNAGRLLQYLRATDGLAGLAMGSSVVFLANAILIGIFWKKPIGVSGDTVQQGDEPNEASPRRLS